jgi:DNA-binding transcriptional LysR family regulator
LTEAGKVLQQEGSRLAAQVERLREAVCQAASGDVATLAVGASTTPGTYLLPRILGRYKRLRPAVRLSLAIENSFEVTRKVLRNEVDLGFIGAAPAEKELVAVPVARDVMVPLASASFPAARARSLDRRKLAAYPFIARERGSGTRRVIDQWARQNRVQLGVSMEFNTPEAVKMAVAEGLGITILPLCAVELEVRCGRLAVLKVRGFRLERTLYAIYHKDKHLSEALKTMIKLAGSL